MASPAQTSGQRLRDLRVHRHLTQVHLAVRAKVAPGTISFAERDQRHPMPLIQERIARVLRVERRDIWPDGEPEEEAS
jgi:transcriptional regulator with XRE-family HTH domain